MSHFLEWLAQACCFGLFIYKWIIIVAVVLTWISADPNNQIVKFVSRTTQPLWVWCEHRMPVMMAHYSAYASILFVIFLQVVLPAEILSINLFLNGISDFTSLIIQSSGHFLQASSIVIQSMLYFFMIVLVAWFIIGLVNPSLNNPLVRIVHVLADPLITPFQRYLPRTRIDWSPLVCTLFFYLISSKIISPIGFYGSNLSFPVSICVY